MTSNLEIIGFITPPEISLKGYYITQLCFQVKDNGICSEVPNSNLEYYRWEIGNGIELWSVFDGDFIQCFTPYYATNGLIPLKLQQELIDNECDYCRGYSGTSIGKEHPDIPVLFDLPNSLLCRNDNLIGSVQTIELCGFANSIEKFCTPEEFKHKNPNLDTRYYIPTGSFSVNNDPNFTQSAVAMLGGDIIDIKEVQNSLTDRTFYHLVINNIVHTLDIIASSGDFQQPPKTGEVVNTRVYFNGKIKSC